MTTIPRPPSAITFDCWDTLLTNVDWKGTFLARRDAIVEIGRVRGIDIDPEKALELIEGSWSEHVAAWRAGRHTGAADAARWVLERLEVEREGDKLDEDVAVELTEAIGGVSSKDNTRVIEGAREALALVRAAGIRTALVCDTGFTPGPAVRGLLEAHGVELDHLVFSDEVGVPKPHKEMFRAALDGVGAEAGRSIHIGDLRRTDVAGARAAGMATIRFAGVHDDGWATEESTGEEADAVLKHWDELPALIGI